MKGTKIVTLFAIAGSLLWACSKDNKGGGNNNGITTDAFKKNMLINYADTLIIPAYNDLQSKLAILEASADNFLATPSLATQTALKTSFKNAYLSFEGISALYFGPGAALQVNNSLNTFPTSVTKIESNITSGVYDFKLLVVADSIQGFPALDYLFFNNDAVQKFNGPTAVNRKKYVKDIFARIKQLITATQTQWQTSYRDNFVNNLQTNVGSPIGSLINQFAFEMDALKGPRVGWPFGKQSNGIVFADKCEGYFSGFTKDLAVANLTALKKYYTGGSGNGIDNYLVLLKKDQLNQDVLAQFDLAIAALQAIPDPMSAAFTANTALVEAAYRQIQKLLTLIKTDVASATAVQITYMDNDGD